MSILCGNESILNPLQKSSLNKKALCDYVINVASGCLHSCVFCYVPSTPVIRTRTAHFKNQGVDDPQMDWGKYLFIRDNLVEQLEKQLSRKKTWEETPAGRGVVLLCSGTDPYQNGQTAAITRAAVETLLKYNKRVRILTRSPLWTKDLDILVHPNVTVGMSIPYLDDELTRQIEPGAPPPSVRLKAMYKGKRAGCRLYVAIAPTPPTMDYESFLGHLETLLTLEPEVMFWEPINARGSNGKRMMAAGLDFVQSIMKPQDWAKNFVNQWKMIEYAADCLGCKERLHIWTDSGLKNYVDSKLLEHWWYKPTVEHWVTSYSVTQLPNHSNIR
ncbi:MAG: radical SAM protein [Symploca sp. SIO2G7]|nr:radical SAM protein [Symploca sp. SIO2G7]